jgi:N-acetylmuramoyl-L-alanine amidase
MILILLAILLSGCTASHAPPQYPMGPIPTVVSPISSCQPKKVVHRVVPKPTNIIFIDAGHGGRDPGTYMRRWPNLKEKTLNLEVAKLVEKQLVLLGYCVAMSRRNDSYIAPKHRVELAAKNKAIIFVSIHTNSCPNKRISGAEIFYYADCKNAARTKSSRQLAVCLCKRFAASLPIKPRGVKAGNLCVIREAVMPAVLIESAFMTNAGEARLLTLPSFKTKLALAIAKGIDDYVHSK